jgi:hypothetical protein
MDNTKQIEEVENFFKHVSIRTFIDYFYVFEKNKGIRSNALIYDAFDKNKEVWTKKAYVSRASKSKRIFEKGLEVMALNFVINSKKEKHLIEKAKVILNDYLARDREY